MIPRIIALFICINSEKSLKDRNASAIPANKIQKLSFLVGDMGLGLSQMAPIHISIIEMSCPKTLKTSMF